ncbi:TonB-dependent receptor [Roseibium algae]|uniref:TonB-dependent receptor n=1 Tax=Roseibium algae TaxID=3123038 RepID=A0ABU8TE98_9HYPH
MGVKTYRIGRSGANTGRAFVAGLMVSTAICITAVSTSSTVFAQGVETRSFSVPAGTLGDALAAFGRQAGLQVSYLSGVVEGRSSAGLSGSATKEQALARLLGGSGLSYRFSNDKSVVITDAEGAAAFVNEDGSMLLDVITVVGGNPSIMPYETAAPTDYISSETIDHYRGSSPADIFRGTPGVMSGEARNGAGAVDVNIRGMQGMGRVAVTIDGAENATNVYQGYQGISNRTYMDPDLLEGVEISKGSDVSSRGIAGTVAMRTVDAGDIVEDGKWFGIRAKGGFGTNTSSPVDGAVGGYGGLSIYRATPSEQGLDRPNPLEPTSGSVSLAAAVQRENFDLLAAYAYRKQGNYHAGTNGKSAEAIDLGEQTVCTWICTTYPNYYVNTGLTNYRAGEEVLNTQLETKSFLAKATGRFGDGHSIKLSYSGFRSEAGDRFASQLTSNRSQPIQQAQTTGTKLDTFAARYRWQPVDSDLINLEANLWRTNMELRNPRRNEYGVSFASLGLPEGYRTGSDIVMLGADLKNKSNFDTRWGAFDLNYGLNFLREDTKPSAFTKELETWLDYRDGERQQVAAFSKAAWKPTDWLTVNAGLRYERYWTQDRNDPYLPRPGYSYDNKTQGDGWSPSAGITLEPLKNIQLYVNYSNVMRAPSLVESGSGFTMNVSPEVTPERASNWEVGTNLIHKGILSSEDTGMIKFGYFNWTIDDYIAREWKTVGGISSMHIYNLDKAKFSGLELSGRYEWGGFMAELGANYYTNVEFCITSDTCENTSLYADYATNQVPPEYSVNLSVSKRFFDDALTLGGRVTHIGPRAVDHGQVTATGSSNFISNIDWDPYTLVDAFADYKVTDNLTASLRVENLTDQYYVDPLSLVQQPGPGRTFYASLTAKF